MTPAPVTTAWSRNTWRGLRGLPALAVCALPVLFGFVIPSGQLLIWGMQTWRTSMDSGFFAIVMNSIELALITAVLAALLALAVSYARRQQPGIMTNSFNRLLGMGYAVPGAVIAVGVLIPFTWLDRHMSRWFGLLSDTDPGLLLSGTIAILVFAYLVRFLALSLNTVDAGLAKIKPSMDEAGKSLGISGFRLLRRVHIPILRGSSAHCRVAGICRRPEGTAGNIDTAAVQFQHAGGAHL